MEKVTLTATISLIDLLSLPSTVESLHVLVGLTGYQFDTMLRPSPVLSLLCFVTAAHAFVPFPSPPQPLPRFAPSYDMFHSSIIMPCNYTGQFEVDVSTQWGIADLDWSNGKKQWIQNHPMTSQEELVQAATNIHQASSGAAKSTSVWVYR